MRNLAFLLVFLASAAHAEDEPAYRAAAEIVLDVSQGMSIGLGDKSAAVGALAAITEVLAKPELQGADITVRTVGGVAAGRARCESTQVLVPSGVTAGPVLEGLRSKPGAVGPRPLTAALEGAVADLPQTPGAMRSIILVTSGADTCGRDVCEAAAELRHTLGLGRVRVVSVGEKTAALACLGEVVVAKTAADVAARVAEVLEATFSPAELTVTALEKNRATEANVEVFVVGDDEPVLRGRSGVPMPIAGGRYHVRVVKPGESLDREGWRRDVELATSTKISMRIALAGEPATLQARVRLNGKPAPEGTRIFVHRPGNTTESLTDGWPEDELHLPAGQYDIRAQIPATGLGSIDVWKPDVKLAPAETTRVTLEARQKLGSVRVRVVSGAEELEGADVLVLPDKSRSLSGSTVAPNETIPLPAGTYTVGVHYETPGGVLQAFQDGVVIADDEVLVKLDVGASSRLVVQVENADEGAGITVGLVKQKGEPPLGYVDAFMEHRVPAGTYDLRIEEPATVGSRVFWARGIVLPPGERKVVTTRKPKAKD